MRAWSLMLIRGAWICSVETFGGGLGASVSAASRANSAGPRPRRTSGRSSANRGGHPGGEHARHFLVGPVLEQPGEEQVAGLEQGQVLFVLDLAGWQEPGGLEVEQGGRDDQEVTDLVQVPAVGALRDVADELVGDLGQGDFGDVQLVLGDQREQQVEWTLEHVEVDLEARRVSRGPRCGVGAAVVDVHNHDGSAVVTRDVAVSLLAAPVPAESLLAGPVPAESLLAGPVPAESLLAGTLLDDGFGVVRGLADGSGVRRLIGHGDAAGQQAVLASRIEVGEQDGNGLPDDPAAVGGGAVAQQGKPGAFQVKQFLGGQIDGDLLGVLLAAAGPALIAIVRTGSGGPQELRDPGQAYPP